MSDLRFKTTAELQAEFGARIRRLRLWRNIDQRTAAASAGVSLSALRHLEAGRSTVETLIRVLRALDHLDAIDTLAPEPLVNPMLLLRTPTPPQRVRRPRGPRKSPNASPAAARRSIQEESKDVLRRDSEAGISGSC